MKYGSVCSGIEAATAAWHSLGWKPAWFSEIEPFPCAVLQHHYPTTPNLGDMTQFKEWPDEPIDFLVGGTPCQSFSVAGLRKGLDDPRGNLMLTYLAILNQYQPKWLVWENVPGVLSSNEGKDFGTFLGGLAELGYGFAYRVLDAQHFGVPQRRKRVFVVGCLGNWRAAAAVLFERHSLQGNTPPIREKREEITRNVAIGIDEECNARIEQFGPLLRGAQGGTRQAVAHIAGTLTAGDGRRRGAGISPESLVAFGGGNTKGPIDVATAQTAHGIRQDFDSETFITIHENQRGEISTNDTAGALKTQGGKPGQGYPCAFNGTSVRRLTPIECERLQGFPDNFTQIPWRNKSPGDCPDGPRYKALGNSMAVPVMKWIGERIQAVDELLNEVAA